MYKKALLLLPLFFVGMCWADLTPQNNKEELKLEKEFKPDGVWEAVGPGSQPNTAYRSLCRVFKAGDAYVVHYHHDSGQSTTGVGMMRGDSFVVAWNEKTKDGLMLGMTWYKIESPTRLTGRWTALGKEMSVHSEILTLIKRYQDE